MILATLIKVRQCTNRFVLTTMMIISCSLSAQTTGTFKAKSSNKTTVIEKLVLNSNGTARVTHGELTYKVSGAIQSQEKIIRETHGFFNELSIQDAIKKMDSPTSQSGLSKLKAFENNGFTSVIIVNYSTSQGHEATFLGAVSKNEIVCLNTGEIIQRSGWLW